MKVYRTLLEIDFVSLLNESKGVTHTGSQFLNAYKKAVMTQPVTHQLINSFLTESKQYQYDNGVLSVARSVSDYINENVYSWHSMRINKEQQFTLQRT